ncbi:YtxH domain-containing protein [Spirillospora sp. NPDC052269]
MKHRVVFMVGAALGYLLGTRAGRERYEQIKQASRQVAGSPAVQGAAGAVRERASDAGERVVEKARERGGALAKGSRRRSHREKAKAEKASAGRAGTKHPGAEKAKSQGRGRGRKSRKARRHATVAPDPGTPGMEAGRENADF